MVWEIDVGTAAAISVGKPPLFPEFFTAEVRCVTLLKKWSIQK
jgi:hypothetical protein